MNSSDDRYLILEQYKVYSDAKEKFIERQFVTNRYYLALNLIILITTYLLSTLTPQYQPVLVLCVIGIAVALMWWINIDSYQVLIKVKYANVLEYLETKLPEQPYHKEYTDYIQMKKRKKLIVFGDCQKTLAIAIAIVYFVVCFYNIANIVRYSFL